MPICCSVASELRATRASTIMQVSGFSVAGIETCIEVPSLKLLFDLGRCPPSAVGLPLAILSHGHLDHMGAIAQHAARRSMMKLGESVYVVPRAVAPQVEAFFNAAGALDGQQIPRRVVALEPGDTFAIGKHRTLRPFETFHRVPSQGYTIWERRHRLRAEFRGLPGERLGELRRNGVQIEEQHEVPLLSFTGDTRVEVLERTPELQLTECLVIETTFLDARVSVAEAREMGHIHLAELSSRGALLPQGKTVLSHFSARYRGEEVAQLLAAGLPDDIRERVTTLSAAPLTAASGVSG